MHMKQYLCTYQLTISNYVLLEVAPEPGLRLTFIAVAAILFVQLRTIKQRLFQILIEHIVQLTHVNSEFIAAF